MIKNPEETPTESHSQISDFRAEFADDPLKRIILAVDCKDLSHAVTIDKRVISQVGTVKVGNEIRNTIDWSGIVRFFNNRNATNYYFDAKFSENPDDMEELVSWFSRETRTVHVNEGLISVQLLTAAGLAIQKALESRGNFMLVTETVSTAMTEDDCFSRYRRSVDEVVYDTACLAEQIGLHGFTASAHEMPGVASNTALSGLRRIAGGIRLKGDNPGDQVRIADPRTAIEKGADMIIVGHSIIDHQDQYDRMMRIADEIDKAKV